MIKHHYTHIHMDFVCGTKSGVVVDPFPQFLKMSFLAAFSDEHAEIGLLYTLTCNNGKLLSFIRP